MWTVGRHLREVRFDRVKIAVLFGIQNERELSVVDTVVVDLLVMQAGGADQFVRGILFPSLFSQTRIRG